MAKLTALLALVALAVPSHAASPRLRRAINSVRANRTCAASTTRAVKNQAAQQNFVITAFAVPVAVPVAPFAPYWYSVADYDYASSLRGSASQQKAPEAQPRETASEGTMREAEPRGSGFRGRASEPEHSIVRDLLKDAEQK